MIIEILSEISKNNIANFFLMHKTFGEIFFHKTLIKVNRIYQNYLVPLKMNFVIYYLEKNTLLLSQ